MITAFVMKEFEAKNGFKTININKTTSNSMVITHFLKTKPIREVVE